MRDSNVGFVYSSFEFEIERNKEIKSGRLIPTDSSVLSEDEYEYKIYSLWITGRADGDGPEIMEVVGPDDTDWTNKLTEEEIEVIKEMITDDLSSYNKGK